MALARRVHQRGETTRFALGDRQPFLRQPVMAPPVIVGFVVQRDRQLLDGAAPEHALNRPVERARAEARLAAGDAGDLLHHAVPVRLAAGEGDHDLEDRRRDGGVEIGGIARQGGRPASRRGYTHSGYNYRRYRRESSPGGERGKVRRTPGRPRSPPTVSRAGTVRI